MSSQITITRDGQQYGPYSMEDLTTHLESGAVLPDELAWMEGMEEWRPLREIVDIQTQPSVPPPLPLPASPMPVQVVQAGEQAHLWNPNAAALWSLLLTPAFGAWLHASNWRMLGNEPKARANMVWFWVVIGYLLVNLLTMVIPALENVNLSWLGILLLFGWYLSVGRSQESLVKKGDIGGYQKKSLTLPVLLGFSGVAGYVLVAVFLAAAIQGGGSVSADDSSNSATNSPGRAMGSLHLKAPIAFSDPSGAVQIEILDMLSGAEAVKKSRVWDHVLRRTQEEGKNLIYFEVKVTNTGSEVELDASHTAFRLETADGATCSPDQTRDYVRGSAPKGRSVRGGVAFAIYGNAAPMTLRFTDKGFRYGRGIEVEAVSPDLSGNDRKGRGNGDPHTLNQGKSTTGAQLAVDYVRLAAAAKYEEAEKMLLPITAPGGNEAYHHIYKSMVEQAPTAKNFKASPGGGDHLEPTEAAKANGVSGIETYTVSFIYTPEGDSRWQDQSYQVIVVRFNGKWYVLDCR